MRSTSALDNSLDVAHHLSVRYPAGHKDRVRGKIVRAASRRFRGRGSEGVAIAGLMKDLKLTHGGFYRHFQDKEELFNEALMASAAEARSRIMAAVQSAEPGRELEALIAAYLSPGHCANPADGCPIAALTTEIARHPKSTRALFEHGLRQGLAVFAPYMPGKSSAERERMVLVLFSGMAGALNLARAAVDEERQLEILDQARKFYLDALCRPGPP